MNIEKYPTTLIQNPNKSLLKQTSKFLNTKQINDDLFAVQLSPLTYSVKTPLQCAIWTLNKSKYYYLKFIDSICGNKNKNYKQGMSAIIKNKEKYERMHTNIYLIQIKKLKTKRICKKKKKNKNICNCSKMLLHLCHE
jgi:hypothetical protein